MSNFSGMDLNSMVPGTNTHRSVVSKTDFLKKDIIKPVVEEQSPKLKTTKALNKLQVLVCSICGVTISVGKKQESNLLEYKMFCPDCKTSFIKKNYVVDSNTKLWHRPFTDKGKAEFDTEVSKLKEKLPYEEILLK